MSPIARMSGGQEAESYGRDPLRLRGRAAVVTGVSRRAGIGYAIARRLAAVGASAFFQHLAPHDADQPWGADPGGPDAVARSVAEARGDGDARVSTSSLHAEVVVARIRLTLRIRSAALRSRLL
jgi:3-oxoacyl-[acyl-carrier protein] reductase